MPRSSSVLVTLALVLTGCSVAPPADPTPVPSDQPSAAASQSPSQSPRPNATPTVTDTPTVSTVEQLETALEQAAPGTVITLAPGTYQRDGGDRWLAAADGTTAAPITLRGPRDAALSSDSITGDYGLHVTGDHWRIEGISVTTATKGIVLDGSVGTVITGVDVGQIGEEGVHFRSCSSDGVLQDSHVHDTGQSKPRFGEGVYVGSASSNWSKYACDGDADNTEGVLIQRTTFTDIAAEGADLKEGVDSGTLRQNTFDNAGYSGENSADSAIDVKANGWLIEDNVVRNPTGRALDAIQTHQVYEGYGTGNTFRANVVEGSWPGFGFGLYPRADNVVECTNTAGSAARGLVGDADQPITCG